MTKNDVIEAYLKFCSVEYDSNDTSVEKTDNMGVLYTEIFDESESSDVQHALQVTLNLDDMTCKAYLDDNEYFVEKFKSYEDIIGALFTYTDFSSLFSFYMDELRKIPSYANYY